MEILNKVQMKIKEKSPTVKVEDSINDKERKCIVISVPRFIYEKDNPLDLDKELFERAKREFPHFEFSNKLLDTEENGTNINFLFHYK